MAPLFVGRLGSLLKFWTSFPAREPPPSGAAACTFFTEIGHIDGDAEDHVTGMIVEFGMGVCCHIV